MGAKSHELLLCDNVNFEDCDDLNYQVDSTTPPDLARTIFPMTLFVTPLNPKRSSRRRLRIFFLLLSFILMGCGQNGGSSPFGEVANCNKLSASESQTIIFRHVRVPNPGLYYFKTLTTLSNGQAIESEVSKMFIN